MTTLTIETKTEDTKALFLREVWMTGEAEDGTKIDLTRSVGGHALILNVKTATGKEYVETINVGKLVNVWANAITEAEGV